MARGNVERFFHRWRLLSPVERIAVARHLAVEHGQDLVAALKLRLAGGDREESLAAIGLIRRLGLVAEFESEIIGQTTGPNPHLASASVAALASGRSDLGREALRAALRHANGRVRANAVEALDQQLAHVANGQTETDLFRALSNSRHNRLRANALRALLRRDPIEASPHICEMLRDDDPLHRVSAIWAARRSRNAAVIMELKSLARADGLEPVRDRAAAAVRIAEHRAMRGGRVVSITGADFR